MRWNDGETARQPTEQAPVVDISFRIDCPQLPVEHAWALSQELLAVLPWLAEEPLAGMHMIHVSESAHGWNRPDAASGDLLQLPRRTRLTLRIPAARVDAATQLQGRTLSVGGYPMAVGKSKTRALEPSTTLLSRHVVSEEGEDEDAFADRVVAEIEDRGIGVRKLVCGRAHRVHTPDRVLLTRSVMLADLNPTEAMQLQHNGIGPGRTLGCGLFIAHKGIDAVGSPVEE